MLELSQAQQIEYLQRSYTAVDGLWFMKVEEQLGFDRALDIDEAVWQVFPKIQARQMKQFCAVQHGISALRDCFEAKLTLDGFAFSTREESAGFSITIATCPWHQKLVKSNRAHLAAAIADRICTAEYGGWAREFGCSFTFRDADRICTGCQGCTLQFREGAA